MNVQIHSDIDTLTIEGLRLRFIAIAIRDSITQLPIVATERYWIFENGREYFVGNLYQCLIKVAATKRELELLANRAIAQGVVCGEGFKNERWMVRWNPREVCNEKDYK